MKKKPRGKVKQRKARQRNAHDTAMLGEFDAAAAWIESKSETSIGALHPGPGAPGGAGVKPVFDQE